MPMTNYLKNLILDATFNDVTLDINAPFGDLYASLHSTPNSLTTAGTELDSLTDLGYERCRLYMAAPVDGEIANDTVASFAANGSTWTTYVSLGIYDNVTSGNLLYYTNNIPAKTLSSGDYVAWQVGDLKVKIN